MSSGLFTPDALELALDRVLVEHVKKQVFVTSACELALVRESRTRWLDRLHQSLEDNTYVPAPAQPCDVPKSHLSVRPGTLLSFADQVVYTACVGAVLPNILDALSWAHPPKDYAYRIRDAKAPDWLRLAYSCWTDFRKASLSELDAGALLMVSTDVTGFYEHVSHELLTSDLRAIASPEPTVALLGKCLARWAVINGRGLPQSHNASHLLAKLYLNVVDRALSDSSFHHCRYVDDMRIFCSDISEAKKALLLLTNAVRRRGLSLQSAKTKTLVAGKAREAVEGVIPTLAPLAKLYLAEIAELLGVNPAYLSVTDAEEALSRSDLTPPTSLLQHAYRVHFMDPAPFEKTLFHYLLSRFGAAGDPYAADHALGLLESHPEETDWILNYYAAVKPPTAAEGQLVAYLSSPEAVYPYQHYLVLRWRSQRLTPATEPFLAFARRILAAPQTPSYLRSAARLFLSLQGSTADLDNLAAAYSTATDEVDRGECLLSIFRMEKSRRNAIFGQAKADGLLPSAAISLVKESKLPGALGAA